MKDEDQAYEQHRQRFIDSGMKWRTDKKFTPMIRQQPRELRDIPFAEECHLHTMQPWEKVFWAALVGFWIALVFLNPFDWGVRNDI